MVALPNGYSMEWLWVISLVPSMDRLMASSWGSPNGVLCVAHGDPTQWAFHGKALGQLNGAFHEKALSLAQVEPPMGIPWNGFGTSH